MIRKKSDHVSSLLLSTPIIASQIVDITRCPSCPTICGRHAVFRVCGRDYLQHKGARTHDLWISFAFTRNTDYLPTTSSNSSVFGSIQNSHFTLERIFLYDQQTIFFRLEARTEVIGHLVFLLGLPACHTANGLQIAVCRMPVLLYYNWNEIFPQQYLLIPCHPLSLRFRIIVTMSFLVVKYQVSRHYFIAMMERTTRVESSTT